MVHSHGYAAQSSSSELAPFDFERREVGEHDVLIDIEFSGMCHSDLHQLRNEWGPGSFPMVPGHEIVGRVAKTGANVKKFKVGDTVGVGCMVNSCRSCSTCKDQEEQFCPKTVWTYNSKELDGTPTFGGYSNNIVVNEHYVVSVSPKLDLAGAAPLLCAGITSYSPLRRAKVTHGSKVGIVGLGGLGHMGVKFAHAFGAHVTVFTHSAGKEADAKRLGADVVVVTKDPKALEPLRGSFDFILNTVSAKHDLGQYLGLLRKDGSMILVGLPDQPYDFNAAGLMGRKNLSFSNIGGIAETQEMLDYCAEHNIVSDVEVIPIQKVNEALERMHKSDVKYRFSIDIKNSLKK